MKVKDISGYLLDNIKIYRSVGNDFEDLYVGDHNFIPSQIGELELRGLGVYDGRTMDIWVR